jgi:protein-glutamine gamma-glutamyltransferase
VSFALSFKLTLYLLVLDSFGALYVTQILGWPEYTIILLVSLGGWWADRLRAAVPHYRQLWDAITAAFLVFAALDLLFLAESFMVAVMHLLLFLLAYKLYNTRTHRDVLDIFILTFMQLVAASSLTVSFGFLLVFCLYMILGTWGVILFHLKRETDLALPEQSRELLARSDLIQPGFLFCSMSVAVASLGLTLAIFLAIPRVGRTYLPLKAQLGTLVTGFTDRVDLGAYGTIQNDPTIVMRISLSGSTGNPDRLPHLLWRGLAFDRFDGQGWSVGDPARVPIRRSGEEFFSIRPVHWGDPMLIAEIFLEPIGTEVIFGLPQILAVHGLFASLSLDTGGGLNLQSPPRSRIRYEVVSQPERFSDTQLRRPAGPGDYPAEIRKAYLQLPDLSPRLRRLAEELAGGATSPYETAVRVATYLDQNLRYSLDLRRESSLDPLDDFLFQTKAGNCEYFAAGMAILLRAAGVPARVVNGFQRGEWNEVGGYFAVRQRDAHSWVEAYLPKAGWVTFDPTPRAGFEAQVFGASSWAGKYFDALRMRWNRYVIDYSLGDQAQIAMNLRSQSRVFRRSMGQALELWSFQIGRNLRRLWRTYGHLAGVLLALLAACAVLLRRAAKGGVGLDWRPWRRATRASVIFYERMLRLLARRGYARPPTATAREFASSLADRPQFHAPVAELTSLYERIRFGGEVLTLTDQSRADALLRELADAPRRA